MQLPSTQMLRESGNLVLHSGGYARGTANATNMNQAPPHPDLTQIPVPSSMNQMSPGAGTAGNGAGSNTNINYYQSNTQNSNRAGVSAGAMLTGGRAANTATQMQQMP